MTTLTQQPEMERQTRHAKSSTSLCLIYNVNKAELNPEHINSK